MAVAYLPGEKPLSKRQISFVSLALHTHCKNDIYPDNYKPFFRILFSLSCLLQVLPMVSILLFLKGFCTFKRSVYMEKENDFVPVIWSGWSKQTSILQGLTLVIFNPF